MKEALFHHFYQRTREERIALLKQVDLLSADSADALRSDATLDAAHADRIGENVIGTYALPLSVAPYFVIDGVDYVVPMVTEEASVVAAAANAAKLFAQNGGIATHVHGRAVIGQIALTDVAAADAERLTHWFTEQKAALLRFADSVRPSLVRRGGGARELKTHYFGGEDGLFVVYLLIDTQEAMGANMVNSILEATAAHIEPELAMLDLTQTPHVLLAILSNDATESLVTATVRLKIETLADTPAAAETRAEKLQAASTLAQLDPYRAATHNKGILNGIDAVVRATGNDTRAIEAGAHAYAARNGAYRGLATWQLDGDVLVGTLTVPAAIGTVGGSIRVHPTAQIALELLRHPNAKTLMAILAAVGLAQNFAALNALVSVGIQSGHMKLQARTLAADVGATGDEIDRVAGHLAKANSYNEEAAREALRQLREEK